MWLFAEGKYWKINGYLRFDVEGETSIIYHAKEIRQQLE